MSSRVLIVDDKAMIRQVLCRLFNSSGGFQVCGEASTGHEALELARALKPDLIVLDLCMPGINGIETAHALRKLDLHAKTILYSLNAEDMVAQEAFAAGCAAVVSKTEGIKTLISKSRAVLGQPAA